jgi:hypothetical protein
MVVEGGYGVYVCPGKVASITWGAHDFVKVASRELFRVLFKGWEAVAEFGGGAVEGNAGEVAYLRVSGEEHSADLAFESVALGVPEEVKVKCLLMRSPRMARILRDCASREVERELMRIVFVRFAHPSLHDTSILCTPDGRVVTTLNVPTSAISTNSFAPTSRNIRSKMRSTTSSLA